MLSWSSARIQYRCLLALLDFHWCHIHRIREEKLDSSGEKRYPARRWVVEWNVAWLSSCRGPLVRHDKKAKNYLALFVGVSGVIVGRV